MRNISAVAVILSSFFTSWASGEIRTFAMEGTVDSIQNPTHALDWVHLGDRVVYTFTFDSNAPDQNMADTQGEYFFLVSNLSIGALSIPATPRGIVIQHPVDSFWVFSNLALPDLNASVADFGLIDQWESNALPDTNLPSAPYALPLFASNRFRIFGQGPAIPPSPYASLSSFEGSIDRFYVVPEPSAVLLLCLGSLLLARRNLTRL